MKRTGILHPAINRILSETGHTDLITICDQGFPIPMGVERVDLALVSGMPTVMDVLEAIDKEFIIDTIVLAEDMAAISPERYQVLQENYPHIRFKPVSHMEFKRISKESRAVFRTGDVVPYANIIVISG